MFIKDPTSAYRKFQLDSHEKKTLKTKGKTIESPSNRVFSAIGMIFMFLLIMSLMIVKVSSKATFQNQTTATIRTRNFRSFTHPTITTNFTTTKTITTRTKTSTATATTTTATVDSAIVQQRKGATTKSPVFNRAAIGPASKSTQSKRTSWKPVKQHTNEKKMRADAQQQARKRLQMQQIQQQQEYHHHNQHQHQHQQKQQQQQQQQKHLKSHANISGEKAYLIEHAGDDQPARDQQPIYGTWQMKARRPQSSLVNEKLISTENISSIENASPPSLSSSAAMAAELSAGLMTTLATPSGFTVDDEDPNDYQKYHVYERLPRRSSTMTTIRNDLNDQIPRPPRLTSRRPSLASLVRRQYLDAPIMNSSYRNEKENNDDKPKPFGFPYEGPTPEGFKKKVEPAVALAPERNAEVNNIQEILQQLQLHPIVAPTRRTPLPQFVMMPPGLHFSGSYKNLKASGIAKFFRNKRNKKPAQLTFPVAMPMSMPMQYYGAFQPPIYGALHQPYQRIALDQFYPFKPRSPNEINLLAMQQQINANRYSNKNKKKKNLLDLNTGMYGYSYKGSTNSNSNGHSNNNGNSNNNSNSTGVYMQQNNQWPRDQFMPHYQQHQWLIMNATQNPKHRRIPFKLNLDIYPMLPPKKEHLPLPMRSPVALANPFADYGSIHRYPNAPANMVYPHYHQHQQNPNEQQQPSLYNAMKFRATGTPLPPPPLTPPPSHTPPINILSPQPSGNVQQISFPDQIPKYSQHIAQHLQQQQYQRPPMNLQQNSFVPLDCTDSDEVDGNNDSQFHPSSNQIMVHLNVYPKQAQPPIPPTVPQPPSTNPFYSFQNRNAMTEPAEIPSGRSIETRHIVASLSNDTATQQQHQQQQQQQQKQLLIEQQSQLLPNDMQQRIARSDGSFSVLAADLEQPMVAADSQKIISSELDNTDLNNNFRFDPDRHLEKIASEAKTASLFRLPVEDLIHFQVDDAL